VASSFFASGTQREPHAPICTTIGNSSIGLREHAVLDQAGEEAPAYPQAL
jgi:hypothetical protein